jgi:NitT/TauT family transport system ATP-binding protein
MNIRLADPISAGRAVVEDVAAVELRKLEKRFSTRAGEPVVALSAIDLRIAKGEFVAVVGPSGCGKTTLMRIVAGLESASAGRVTVSGEPVRGPSDHVGIVFQQATLLPWYSVLDNVLMPLSVKGARTPAGVARAHDLLALVGLRDFARKYPFELSGGMQQRVAICRALIRNPDLLLMDEPFGALDAMTRESMNVELMRWWSAERRTVLFITHSIPEAVLLGDRVVVMSPRPGRIAEILPVPIPRPRDLRTMATAEFGGLCDHVRSQFGAASGVL